MFFKKKRQYALTDAAWEKQRQAYLRTEPDLSTEFDRFRRQGRQPVNTIEHLTLKAEREVQPPTRLPSGYHRMRVLAGMAQVSLKATEYLLQTGDEIIFGINSRDVVVSNAGTDALQLEIAN